MAVDTRKDLKFPEELKVEIDPKILRLLERYCKATNFRVDAVVQLAIEAYLEGVYS